MKKRLFSILLALCMVLYLVPTTAFAEDSAEEPPVCSCETACTAEAMNADCPICGVEGALPENCAKCAQPADAAAVQPEGEVSDPQPEISLTGLIGGNETVTEVSNADELTAAIADSNVSTVRLAGDISISNSLTVTRTVTLDLNGHVLQMTGNDSDPVIEVKKDSIGVGIGNLTLTDSAPNTAHKFTPNADGLWVLNEENGTETVNGGVITGSKEIGIWVNGGYGPPLTQKPAEADCARLIMTGGNIVGCAAAAGGGVCAAYYAYFTMTGGSIRGCVAKGGGGVFLSISSSFAMGGSALIADCISTDGGSCGGGGIGADLGALVALSGNAVIQNCTAQHGGGVYLNNATLTMSENASVTGCNSIAGGGVSARGNATESDPPFFTMEGSSSITDCTALDGGGIFVSTSGGKVSLSGSAKIKNCRTVKRDGVGFPDVTGGGVHVISGSFEMSGGSIENCTAVNGGDSVFVCTEGNGKFTMTGGTVDGSITMPYTVGNNTVYMDGLGNAAYPYQISTADQLKLFRDKVNNATKTEDTKICAELTEDIDLNGEAWTPIGIGEPVYWGIRSYSGTFDGKGHTIKNLSIDRSAQNVGLFGYVYGGTIRNLTVSGSVKGSNFTGGIAGGADSGTFENCANLCEVQGGTTENDTTGGIIGFAYFGDNLIVRDCYNVGSITGRHAGGIIGQCNNWLETIRNCYNAGTVTGTANVGAIIGIYSSDKIYNCYYLEGSVIRNGNGDKASIAKTATEFADGTVLALLKAGERDNNADPWADECKYLAAAGKTLPVFKGQGDAHDHQSNDWKSNETEHWQVCTCGAVFHKAQHSGGTATCTAKAVCEFCNAEYGEKLPHDFTAETVDAKYLKSAATCTEKAVYYKSCAVCGLSSEGTADEATFFSGNALDHDWGAWTQNSDEKTHTRACKRDGTHTETKDCSGGTATCKDKARCAVCGKPYGELDAKSHADLKHIPAKAATRTAEGNIEYWHCDGCSKYFSDKDGTKEIKKADTVTAKRKGSSTTAKLEDDPQSASTGDTGNLALWITLLFASGGAALGTTVVSRKKRANR